MNVTAATTAAPATKTDADKTTVDYNSFLKLLVAQAQNQDPTNPMDSSQYLSQLASFSSVEQAIKTNAKLDALVAGGLSQANGLIGRTLTSADGATTGTVAAVSLSAGTLTALLADGRSLVIGDGATIAAA